MKTVEKFCYDAPDGVKAWVMYKQFNINSKLKQINDNKSFAIIKQQTEPSYLHTSTIFIPTPPPPFLISTPNQIKEQWYSDRALENKPKGF